MIVRSLCNSCLQPYELLLQSSDVELVKQIADEKGFTAPCPRLCGGSINLVGEPVIAEMSKKLRDPISLTGKQLYQAVGGLGLPDEIPKDELTIVSMLKANKITKAVVESIDGKFYLHELVLDNGVTVHLSGGPRGAQVLKMTKEAPNGS